MRRLVITLALAVGIAVPMSAEAGIYEHMTLAKAHGLVTKMSRKWVNSRPESSLWYSAPSACLRLGSAKFECEVNVWYNAAGTIPFATLTIDVWNGQVASNGMFWSHQSVAHVQWYD